MPASDSWDCSKVNITQLASCVNVCYTSVMLTFKYRLFPTKGQRRALQQTLDACRWVYNETLATRKNAWEQTGQTISLYDTNKLLTIWKVHKPELRQAHSQILQNAQERVDLAFKAFFRRVKAGAPGGPLPGYPRFKSYGCYDSFTFKQSGFKLEGGKLFLSKIGFVAIKLHRTIGGTINTLTVRRDSLGNWYACFSCEVEPQPLPPNDKVVGIDLGLTTFAYLSDGIKIKRQHWMKRDANDIARLQRKKEQFAKGSPERRKVIRALQHAYKRSTNRRTNFAHQESRKLVKTYQFIAFEDLNIRGMQSEGDKDHNRGIADVAWHRFVQFTTYKAENAGRGVALVNPKNTTQMCSSCGAIVPKAISVRLHDCPHCGLRLNRDYNAALNILARGLASIGNASASVAVEAHDI
jgi:putative transposase